MAIYKLILHHYGQHNTIKDTQIQTPKLQIYGSVLPLNW